MISPEQLQTFRTFRARASGLVICAGAGMGVDSGLPDFRGNHGFWRAYPPYARLGLGFTELANPGWFRRDPAFAWGFYGHRLELYRRTRPHTGFEILRRWAEAVPAGGFVFTSNVDGQFQRAGFDEGRLVEAHGAIDWMQCMDACGAGLFSAAPFQLDIDEATMRAREPLPRCPRCGALARPNILMFGDGGWEPERTEAQEARLARWLEALGRAPLLVIECGAGSAVPTVRHFSERLSRRADTLLVRLNPREPEVPRGHIGLTLGALEGLRALDGSEPAAHGE